MDSLRLLHWAGQTSDLQEHLARELGHGHFTRRECVADHNVLIRAAQKVLHLVFGSVFRQK